MAIGVGGTGVAVGVGGRDGVTGLEAAEEVPAPTALMAWTVKVYMVPLVSPVMVAIRTLPTSRGLLRLAGLDVNL